MMGVFETLGELVGKAFKALADTLVKRLTWNPETLKEIDAELVTKSIKPEMFQTAEFKELVKVLQVKLAHSPESIVDWLADTIDAALTVVYEYLIDIITPPVPVTFEKAQERAGKILGIALDFSVLITLIDTLATALSVTLIRNLCHLGQLFMSTIGSLKC